MFFTILFTTAAPIFLAPLLLLIQYIKLPIRCVSWEQLMSVMKHFAMSVCTCLKVSVNYGQPVRVCVCFPKTKWVNMVCRILNLEGHWYCMIVSKVTTIYQCFVKTKQKSNVCMWGCLYRGNRLEYCAAHSYFNCAVAMMTNVVKKKTT